MVWNVSLTIRNSSASRVEMHVNATEARRSLLNHVRKNKWKIQGNGSKGLLVKRDGALNLIAASYEIK